ETAFTLAIVTLLHHCRSTFLVGFHADGHETQDVFRQTHLTLHLVESSRRSGDVHERVVRLAVLVDAVGEGLQSPVLDPAYGAAMRFDHTLVLFYKSFDLLRRQILAGKKHMFIKSHCLCLSSVSLSAPAAKAS